MTLRTGLTLLILANLVNLVRSYVDWFVLDVVQLPLFIAALVALWPRRGENR